MPDSNRMSLIPCLHVLSVSSALFFEVLFGYVSALAPSYEVFALSRLLVGLMNGGMALVCFVLTQEYVGKSYWAMTGNAHRTASFGGVAQKCQCFKLCCLGRGEY